MPNSCTLVAPELTSSFAGSPSPTFSFLKNNPNYFGFEAQYKYGSSVCQYASKKSFTPVLVTGKTTVTCTMSVDKGKARSSILCPTLTNPKIPDGTHTISHINVHADCDPPVNTKFIVGPSPTPVTDWVYTTAYSTVTAQSPPAETVTSYTVTKTSTAYSNTQTVSSSATQTDTIYANYCPPVPSSGTTSKSSSAWSPSWSPSPWTTTSTPSKTWISTTPSSTPKGDKKCPDNDGDIIITSRGVWIIECYIDRTNSDLGPVSASNYTDCVNKCSANINCVDVSYVPSGPCYLKSDQGDKQTNNNVWGARLEQYVKPSTTTKSPAPTATGPTCPGWDGKNYYTNGKVFYIQCGVDHSGGDLSPGSPVYGVDFPGCMDACARNKDCIDVSSSGSACYLKSSLTPVEYNDQVLGAVLVGTYDATTTKTTGLPSGASATKGAAPTSSGMQCPAANGTTFTGLCGSQYTIECGFDRGGGDIGSKDAYTLEDCINICDQTAGCVDVSWARGSPGACYLKNAQNSPSYNNIWGARQTRACKSKNKIRMIRENLSRMFRRVAEEEDEDASGDEEVQPVEDSSSDEENPTARLNRKRIAPKFRREPEENSEDEVEDADSNSSESSDDEVPTIRLHRKRVAPVFERNSDKEKDKDKDKEKNNDDSSSSDEDDDEDDDTKTKKYGSPDATYGNPSTVKATKGTTSTVTATPKPTTKTVTVGKDTATTVATTKTVTVVIQTKTTVTTCSTTAAYTRP